MGSTKIKRILNQDISGTTKPKLRVCAYCRVSSKSEEQLTSYETQVAVYTEKISSEPGWEFVGIYADRGTSATMMARRKEFLRMLEDCEKGLIDCVICKSLSRFARNTLDALNCIKKLRDLGVRLILEKEGIDTDMISSEILLSVFAAFAQEESHSHSENVRWGKRKRLQNGEPLLIRCYGYRKNEANDNIEIVPREAEAVRLIFDLYEHGTSVPEITRILFEKGYTRPDGKDKVWDHSRIHYMIANEKYAGEVPSYYIENHHQAIISRKQFNRCKQILTMRRTPHPDMPGKYNNQYPLGDKLVCPICGSRLFKRSIKIQRPGSGWSCEIGEHACRQFIIRASFVDQALLNAYHTLDAGIVEKKLDSPKFGSEAEIMLRYKREYPRMKKVDYWWVDDLVDHIEFGKHIRTTKELIALEVKGTPDPDDRSMKVFWKCGLVTMVPSDVFYDSDLPGRIAKRYYNQQQRKAEKKKTSKGKGRDKK